MRIQFVALLVVVAIEAVVRACFLQGFLVVLWRIVLSFEVLEEEDGWEEASRASADSGWMTLWMIPTCCASGRPFVVFLSSVLHLVSCACLSPAGLKQRIKVVRNASATNRRIFNHK